MKRFAAVLALAAVMTAGAGAQEHIHKREFARKLFSKGAFIKTGISAVWSTARNSPHEWGRTIGGFGKRAASSYGQRAIMGVVEFSTAELWTHEDLRYHKSELHGTFPRLKYAVFRTFYVPRDNRSGKTFAAGRVMGAFAAGEISRSWMPQRVATFGAGISSAGISLGIDVGFNVLREFWPRRH
jgi:hypothetical protein